MDLAPLGPLASSQPQFRTSVRAPHGRRAGKKLGLDTSVSWVWDTPPAKVFPPDGRNSFSSRTCTGEAGRPQESNLRRTERDQQNLERNLRPPLVRRLDAERGQLSGADELLLICCCSRAPPPEQLRTRRGAAVARERVAARCFVLATGFSAEQWPTPSCTPPLASARIARALLLPTASGAICMGPRCIGPREFSPCLCPVTDYDGGSTCQLAPNR